MIAPPLWKASIALTKPEAADVSAALELDGSAQAVLIVEEPFADGAVVEALYIAQPDANYLSRIAGRDVTVEPLPDQDWIRLSQEGLPPVRAGRFFVYGAHDAGQVPHGVIPIKIEAGLAFGTGHHETTALCLEALSDMARERSFRNVLDLGTGTGLLAIGAVKLWKRRVMASDIDPVAVEVARDNAIANDAGPWVAAAVADGLASPILSRAAPYDLLIANILAGPLTRLAPEIIRSLAPGAVLLLSGLLNNQEKLVTSFYRDLRFVGARRAGPWSALVLEKPAR
ncbi:MAG TPA: 50S ribosomal protein L11 methyltransferase [Rhizomicrobium sp.]|jgi:ribosomal protein L11 methyltransferase|nr:50S ribosomal protein L11 methyltransferase [Rhizomicrobium sp.]